MDSFIARQPIFDARQGVHGYELLFRSGPENFFAGADGDVASSRVIGEGLHGFGLDHLIGGKKAFINVSRQVLVDGLIQVLPNSRAVVEILETVDPDEEVLAACRRLKAAGYQIALDDFVARPDYGRFVDLADVIKVDFLTTSAAERRRLAGAYSRRGIHMLAEKVETHEDFVHGLEAGYSYFQGFFFCRPEVLSRRGIPTARRNWLRFLEEVTRPGLDCSKLEPILGRDPALAVQLLRFLNSACFGPRTRVNSIHSALRLLGERCIRQRASLMALIGLGEDKPTELLTTALVRARFCELAGEAARLDLHADDLFLLGMLSTLDALTDRPLEEVLGEMPVSPEIRSALLGGSTPLGRLYSLVLAYERGEWGGLAELCGEMHLDEEIVPDMYARSVEWADNVPRR